MQAISIESRAPRWSALGVPLGFAVIAGWCLAGGGLLFREHLTAEQAEPFRATAAVVLVLLGLWQARLALLAWRPRAVQRTHRSHSSDCSTLKFSGRRLRAFARWVSAGLVLSYIAGLLAGPEHGAAYLFLSLLVAWYTVAVWLLVMGPNHLPAGVRRVLQFVALRLVRWLGWSAYLLLLFPLGTELTLRAMACFSAGPVPFSAGPLQTAGVLPELRIKSVADERLGTQARAVESPQFGGRATNSQGYWDDEFQIEQRPGVLRVGAIGGALSRVCAATEGFLRRIERADLEVYNFGVPTAGCGTLADQVAGEVAQYDPDLVLAFIEVGEDLTQDTVQPGAFDLSWLHTYQLGKPWLPGGQQKVAEQAKSATDIEQTHLKQLAGKLAICRTPIDDRMRARWRKLFADLNRLAAVCRAHDMQLALIVAPAEFQVNAALGNIVRRRAGYAPENIDLTLPQRRLADYGRQQNLTVIDLLPHLTASRAAAFDRHQASFNAHGHTVATDVLAHWMRNRRGGLGEATALVK